MERSIRANRKKIGTSGGQSKENAMIKCPRCGADAQWGAPQCPQCFAQFVAPPSPPPPQVAPHQAVQNPGFPQPKPSLWIPISLVAGLVLFGGLWLVFKPK